MADDEPLVALVRAIPQSAWAELDEIIEQLANDPQPYDWQGGDRTTSGAIQMPWVSYGASAERGLGWLRGQQLITPLADWTNWYTPNRGVDAVSLDATSIADTVRLATSIVRGDRFSEGTIATALDNGVFVAILRRLRRWNAEERATAP